MYVSERGCRTEDGGPGRPADLAGRGSDVADRSNRFAQMVHVSTGVGAEVGGRTLGDGCKGLAA